MSRPSGPVGGPHCEGTEVTLNVVHIQVIPVQLLGVGGDRTQRGECMVSFVSMHLSVWM